jgi:beta-glucosidase-like glycosyl hydrolase
MGDGATVSGVDEGIARVYDYETFYQKNIQGYRGAIASQTGTIMVSYSSVLGLPMAINGPMLNHRLKQLENYDGFLISDYDELGKVAS